VSTFAVGIAADIAIADLVGRSALGVAVLGLAHLVAAAIGRAPPAATARRAP
jgi:hypothetical protein